jgi:hypothetical protein
MNRVCVAAWMLVLMLETGCPVGGEAGVLHQAFLRDAAQKWAHEGCDPGNIWDDCGSEHFHQCLAVCEEEMKRRARK